MRKQTTRRLAVAPIVALFLSAFALSAQDETPVAQAAPSARAAGNVVTSRAVPIPGASLRLVETSTGRAWVSWTDENGHFDLHGLPAGHYRIEASQLGFDSATKEFELTDKLGPIELTLKVASLESIEATPSQASEGAAGRANPAASSPHFRGQRTTRRRSRRSSFSSGRGRFRSSVVLSSQLIEVQKEFGSADQSFPA